MIEYKKKPASRPELTAAYSIYPYSDKLAEKLTKMSRFGDEIILYRSRVINGCKKILVPRAAFPLSLNDKRIIGVPVDFVSSFKARDYEQTRVVSEAITLLNSGLSFILQSGTGTGKTVMAMELIKQVGRKVAIIVPKEDLKERWAQEARAILNLKDKDIGIIQADKVSVKGKKLVICMLKSLATPGRYPPEIFRDFGLVIWDEVHNVGATTFANSPWLFPAKLRLGLSATPKRVDGKDIVFKSHIGKVLVKSIGTKLTPNVYMIKSPWTCPSVTRKVDGVFKRIPIPHSPGKTMHINKMIAHHRERNLMIARCVVRCWEKGRNIMVFSDLKIHLELLFEACRYYKIPSKDMAYYIGGLTHKQRDDAEARRILFSTFKFASEGTNVPKFDSLILCTPRSEVEQIVGRILRIHPNKPKPALFDIVDNGSPVFYGYAGKRRAYYSKYNFTVTDVTRA